MAITNGRNLAELASLINSDGKISAEAFSAELTASIDPTLYDSASDVPFEDAVKGTQVFVASEGLLIKLTDSDWYSIDGSTGAAAAPIPTQAQGAVSGYTSGGLNPDTGVTDTIEKSPFAADANATDVGDLTQGTYGSAGQSSSVSGYASGGGPASRSKIEKFPFATDGNATNIGDLTLARNYVTGQSSSTSGYTSSGTAPQLGPTLSVDNTIDKFSFSADGNATDVGDLTANKWGASGQSSTESGYVSGSWQASLTNVIEKFPFATDANATDVGDLTVARGLAVGQNSAESGYVSGGIDAANVKVNVIDKFPFATDGNATDVGDLTLGRDFSAGQSSTQSGYSSGGRSPPWVNTIDKFPFATDGNATDVGDLTVVKAYLTGQQV